MMLNISILPVDDATRCVLTDEVTHTHIHTYVNQDHHQFQWLSSLHACAHYLFLLINEYVYHMFFYSSLRHTGKYTVQ